MASVALQKKVVTLLKVAQTLINLKCQVNWEVLAERMGGTWSVLTLNEVRMLEADGWKPEVIERLWDLNGLVQDLINLIEVPEYELRRAQRRVRLDLDRMVRSFARTDKPSSKSSLGLAELKRLMGPPSRAEQVVIDVVRQHGPVRSQQQILSLLSKQGKKELSDGTLKKVCADLRKRGVLASPPTGRGYELGPLA